MRLGSSSGWVVSKLDTQLVDNATGDIPQNINFAIRAEIAKLFLYKNGVKPIEVVWPRRCLPRIWLMLLEVTPSLLPAIDLRSDASARDAAPPLSRLTAP